MKHLLSMVALATLTLVGTSCKDKNEPKTKTNTTETNTGNTGNGGTNQGGHTIKNDNAPVNPILTTIRSIKMEAGKPVMGADGRPVFEYSHKGAIFQDLAGHGAMGPTVTLSNKVYIVRTANGGYARLQVTDWTNEKKKTGYITIKYVYPAQLGSAINSDSQIKTVTIDATAYDKYVYFSFANGNEVGKAVYNDASWKAKDNWDIAFHRYDLRTNGGTGGNGQGAAAETTTTDIKENIAEPSFDDFKVDVDQTILVQFGAPAK